MRSAACCSPTGWCWLPQHWSGTFMSDPSCQIRNHNGWYSQHMSAPLKLSRSHGWIHQVCLKVDFDHNPFLKLKLYLIHPSRCQFAATAFDRRTPAVMIIPWIRMSPWSRQCVAKVKSPHWSRSMVWCAMWPMILVFPGNRAKNLWTNLSVKWFGVLFFVGW